jgi:hypothetical protein
MKKITLFSMFASTIFSFKSEAQITLTSENFPPLSTYTTLDGMNIQNFPFGAMPETWDFGNVFMPFLETLQYPNATDPFFTPLCQSYRTASRTALGATIPVQYYWTKNTEYFGEKGWKLSQSSANLSAYTGNASDNVVFPEQRQLFDVSREILRFPATYGQINHTDSRRVMNFNLSIAAYGLNNTPGQLVTHLHRADTIVGYGQMRVYTPQGPSIYYEVLAMKSWQYELDSFYLAGQPAPQALMDAFGLSQNQNDDSDKANRLYFYRENNSAPFLLMNFGSNPFQFYTGIFIHGDNLQVASNEELEKESYQVFIYPNPSNGNSVTIQYFGINLNNVNYTIRDINGRVVQSVKNQLIHGNKIEIQMNDEISDGYYFVEVVDSENKLIGNEKIHVIK